MNTPTIENLIKKTGENIALTPQERAKLHAALSTYRSAHPLSPTPVPSGWVMLFSRSAFTALASIMLLIGGSGSLLYAASGTLPGDAFYPIKVAIVEPLQSALIFSTGAQAAWDRTLAERRLTEAAELAEQGRLAPATEASLLVNFEHAVNASLAITTTTPQTTTDVTDTDFAARLSAYTTVLAQADSKHGATTTALLRHSVAVQAARYASSAAVAPSPEAARTLQVAADSAVTSSAHLLKSVGNSLDATSTAHARKSFQEAANLSVEGSTLLKKHDTSGAARIFQSVLSAVARLDVLTHAATSLNINAFPTSTATTTTEATSTLDLLDSSGDQDGILH